MVSKILINIVVRISVYRVEHNFTLDTFCSNNFAKSCFDHSNLTFYMTRDDEMSLRVRYE